MLLVWTDALLVVYQNFLKTNNKLYVYRLGLYGSDGIL